jgi:hypothetical protein
VVALGGVTVDRSEPAWLAFNRSGNVIAAVYGEDSRIATERTVELGAPLQLIAAIRRWPPGDRSYPEPICQEELITQHHLTLECAFCGREIDDLFYDYRKNKSLNPLFDDEAQEAFCSDECLSAYDRAAQLEYH